MSNFSSQYTLAFEKAANDVLESSELLEQIRELAKHMAQAFSDGKSKTQVSHLEVLGFSTRRFHDITAYVQRQTGKEKKAHEGWLTLENSKEKRTLGEKTVDFLKSIGQKADEAWGEHQKKFAEEINDLARERCKASAEESKESEKAQQQLEKAQKNVEGEQKNALRLKIASVALRHLHSAYLYEPIREGRRT